MINFSFHKQHGQSLIEMLVSISIAVVSILGVLILVSRSLGLNRVTAEQYVATYLASEGIEIVRNMFDQKFIATQADPLHQPNELYGWWGGSPQNSIIPGPSITFSVPRAYEIEYNSSALTPGSTCAFNSPVPTEASVRTYFDTCGTLRFLNLDPATGVYSYGAGQPTTGVYSYGAGQPTKFKRAIIIDCPQEFQALCSAGTNLDYRVTSAVAWQSKNGKFVVQLEDHFLPWRIP